MKKILFSVAIFIFFLGGCNKSDTLGLPEETQTGKNTFGAYLDGKQFIAASTLFGLVKPLSVNYYSDSNFFL